MDYQNEKCFGLYVFEGIDNVGKTTIIQKLKKKIYESIGCECVIVAFPGNEPRTLGSLVYDIHHNQARYFDVSLNEISLQLLHIASHIDLIQGKLRKLNSERCIILLDRYWWSTYVYGLVGELDDNIVRAMLEPELIQWNGITVSKIFLLEREQRERDYEDAKDRKIVGLYRELASKETKSVIIDNNGSIEEVVTQIYDNIIGDIELWDLGN